MARPARFRSRFDGWSRRKRIAAGIVAGTTAIVVGIAAAAILAHGEFTGGGNVLPTPPPDDVQFTAAPVVGATSNGDRMTPITCTASAPSYPASSVEVNIDGAPGAWCDITFTAMMPVQSGELQNVTFAPNTVNVAVLDAPTINISGPVTGADPAYVDCKTTARKNSQGTTIGESNQFPVGQAKKVVVRFTVSPTAAPGAFTAAADAGIAVADDAVPANCPRAT